MKKNNINKQKNNDAKNKRSCNTNVVYTPNRIANGSLASSILLIIALYLSHQCNKGFKLSSVLLACCCSPCYVLYKLVTGIDKCFK